MYKNFIKPFFDTIAALCGLILLFPILLIVTIFLFFANHGKPFFYQLRPGKNTKIFKIVKFKTMNDRKDSNEHLLPDAERMTKIGNFVRKTSLDEIPQLWNVLVGDMSLIGPRPLLPEYLPFYNNVQKRRHEVKPGITGWAQVNGRNAINWQQKFELDVWYVEQINFVLDIKIIFKTIYNILTSKEISADGHATMPRFDELEN
jgi:undecaprenyl phosphate N,N'-diacetylbacillosamine 1-phosphate transferase